MVRADNCTGQRNSTQTQYGLRDTSKETLIYSVIASEAKKQSLSSCSIERRDCFASLAKTEKGIYQRFPNGLKSLLHPAPAPERVRAITSSRAIADKIRNILQERRASTMTHLQVAHP